MRFGVYVLLFFVLATPAAAFELMVDGDATRSSYAFSVGENITVGYQAENATTIIDVEVTSTDPLLETALQQRLDEKTLGALGDSATTSVAVTEQYPSVEGDVTLRIAYLDEQMREQTYERTFHLSITGGEKSPVPGWATGLPEDALIVVLAEYANYTIPRLDPGLSYTDLRGPDADALGYSRAEYARLVSQWRTADDKKRFEEQLPAFTLLSRETVQAQPPADGPQQRSLSPRTTFTISVYNVTHDDNTITKSKVIVSAHADDEFLGNGSVVVEVPKELSRTASELRLKGFPEIVREDPVLKWSLKNVPQDQVKDYSFTSSGDAQNFEVLAEASADEPGLLAKLLLFFLGD